LKRLAACIDKGLALVETSLHEVARDVVHLRVIYSTLDPTTGPPSERRADFDEMVAELRATPSPIHVAMADGMERWAPGLFGGDDDRAWDNDPPAENDVAPTETPQDSSSEETPPALPGDNLELERWFRHPKGHERRIHGHAHAGVRIVHEGPTLLPTLDAHLRHPAPFTAEELIPSLRATAPPSQHDTESRRKIMRRARSRKHRPILLADLERRYRLVLGR
jgi:hypothetical protein